MPSEEAKLACLEARVDNHEKTIETMCIDIKEIKDKLLLRPSWAVLSIITLLSTLCTGLTVFVATKF